LFPLVIGTFLLLCFAQIASAGQANVFVYHRFGDSRFPSTNISIENFQSHLEILQKRDFTVLTLGQILDRIKSGESLPQRCAAITVDDAYRSFLTNGWPLLKSFGFPATLFVSTDMVGGKDYLGWQELKNLRDEGVELGNHSASHAYLLDRVKGGDWQAGVLGDIERSQQAFARNLGFKPRFFAYPYGEFAPELVALVRQAGFDAAFGQQSGVLTPDQDHFRLPRFPTGGVYTKSEEFKAKLLMKHLPVKVISPASTLLDAENPPKLVFSLADGPYDKRTMRCYVPGQPECRVNRVPGEDNLYEVQANSPLAGRRSKYTITASGGSEGGWYWFSQLWVLPRR
jgi:peptidoglycan/xylan/chitin deacetylase (PgdA/CDA1 family)